MEKTNQYFELTIPQENIWMQEQMNPNTNINLIYGTLSIEKKMDLDNLKAAINRVIETNDALRIRLIEVDTKPMQYIADYEEDEIPVYFLEDDNSEKMSAIVHSVGLEHINILGSKLYDFRIIYMPNRVCICVKMHHIIADAWSMAQLFVQNLLKSYEEIEKGQLPTQNPSYENYIMKIENYKKSDHYLRDENFWKKYVKSLNCRNEFDIPKSKKCYRIKKQLGNCLSEKIEKFCQKNSISEYAFFLGTISIYFSKIFSTDNLVIGTPFLNRKKADKEFETMGMFIATLPLHVTVSSNSEFVSLCKQINATNLSCFKHSNYPYQEIQKAYSTFSQSSTNLYEIAFSYQLNNLENEFDRKIYRNTWFANDVQNTPLVISYFNHFGEQELCYDYLSSLMDEKDIDLMHERLLVIIEQILKNPTQTIEHIKILSASDIALLQEFNNTGNITLSEETIVSRFKKIAQANKNKIALKYNNQEMTYRQLDEQSNAVANSIIQRKIKKGSPVAIIFDKNLDMFVTMLGVMKAGCYYIPILPEEQQERAEFIVQNSEAVLLITEEKYSTQIGSHIIENRITIDELLQGNTAYPAVNIKPTDLCYFIYTSGSTGTPKGVMLKHENVISFILSMNADENLKYVPGDIAISLLKYSFDAAACDIYTMLLNGGKLIILPKELELNPLEIAKLIEKEQVTRFVTVSKWVEQIQHVGKHYKIDLSSIKLIAIGGESLKTEKFKYLYDNYPKLKLCNVYGPTETTILVTSHRIIEKDVKNNYIPIGAPIPYARAMILDSKTNEVLPINTKGELVIFEDNTSIHNIAKGYFKLDEKTKQSFIRFENPYTKKQVFGYKTGDSAKINKDLELDFFGRNDDYRKVHGGYLVSLTEVENKIQQILGTTLGVCVISVPIRKTNSIILFVCKKSDSTNISISDIKEEIDEHLTFYMRPKKIIEIRKFPFTTNGKIDKKYLEKKALEYLNQKSEMILPTNKYEQQIYDIVHEIVGFDFSITDDFEEDLGIDSLNMTLLYSKLNNKKISIQDLYNYPTVKDLAYLIKKEFNSDEEIDSDDIKILNASSQMDLSKILLTGVTGFVGSHLLRELTENPDIQKIYCVVRQNLHATSQERFETRISQYFDKETCEKIKKKVVVINADLRKKNLGLSNTAYQHLFKDIKTIINAAANVKHIGKYHTSYIDNVETVQHLIDICLEFSISLAHISTLSIHGYQTANVKDIFTENKLNVHQTFNSNPYLLSKFEAEQLILNNITNNHLNAKIFRIGNIMPRIEDGKFQTNLDTNGFLLAIHAFGQLQLYTNEMETTQICLTPVDDCAIAISEILKSDYCNTIYHIENTQKIKIGSLLDIFKERAFHFTEVSEKNFEKTLLSDYSIGIEYLKSVLATNYTKHNSIITEEILQKIQFKWRPIQKNYLENIINLSMKIK